MADIEIRIPAPYAAQQEILKRAKRNNLLILSRRWGKTTISSTLLLKRSLIESKFRGAWSAPTWKLMLQTFEEHRNLLRDVTKRVSREDRRIELYNGSMVEYWSSDDTQAGRGRKYHLWVSDESQRQRNLSKFIRGSVRPTLADYRGTLYVLGTANGEGSELHEFYLDCLADAAWYVAHGSLDQNPYIHPDEIAQMRRDLGPEMAAQELDSQWVKVDGITPLVRAMTWGELYQEKENKVWTKVLAVDSSISGDLTAVVGIWNDPETNHAYVDYSDVICLEPDARTGEIDYESLEQLLWERWQTGRYSVIAYDPYQMVSLAQRLKTKGVRTFEFTQNNMRVKADSYLRQRINEGTLHHPDHHVLTEHVLNATLKYTQDSFRLVKGTKSDKIDTAVALSMALWTLHETKSHGLQTFSPQVAGTVSPRFPATSSLGTPFDYLKALNPWKR